MSAANPRTESVFWAAQAIASPAERARYLDRACGGDSHLRGRVEELLAAYPKAEDFLEAPAPGPALTAEEVPAPERPGTVVGPYKLLEPVGEGGMGTVWLAQQTEPVRRRVAVKLIKAGMDSRQVLARFEAERQALALMDHPNIARVLDAGTSGAGRPYFVMDLVKGVPITRYCDERRLTPRQRLELFFPVCQAVQHAHQKGVIHRDLKPSNVLVALYDGRPVPKVIDFGVAKAAGQPLTDKTLVTGFGAVVGTPEYMSPEQATLNQLDVDTRSDIYSLGVLLYELLAGSPPFSRQMLENGGGVLEMLRVIREQEPTKPSAKLSTAQSLPTLAANRGTEPAKLTKLVKGELDWIVMKALEKDRARRYETASAFAADVQRYLADEPVLACPPSAGYRLRKFARRRRGWLATAAGVFLAVAVMAASVGWALGDRAARLEAVGGQVRASLDAARILIGENKLAAAREKLAQARAQLGRDGVALGGLAAEVAAGEAELDLFQRFLNRIDQAHQAETAPLLEAALTADGRHRGAGTPALAKTGERRPDAAVPLLLEALGCYGVLERDDWASTLEGSLWGGPQVEQIRRLAYEELLWLADDVLRRKPEYRSGQKLPPEADARAARVYLGKAEGAHRPTQALYALRALCHKVLGDEAAAQADTRLAAQTPPTMALDHFLRGQAAFDAKQLAEAVQAYEAALRLEPTHYWSMMRLGYCLCDRGRGPEDFARAATAFTGCILKRPDHAHAYFSRANAYRQLGRYGEAVADYSTAIELDPKHANAWSNRGSAYAKLGRPDKALADYSQAIELDPEFASAWHNRGWAYHKLGQPDRALADYSKAIELDPKYARAWSERGVAYNWLGRPDKALADCSKALGLDPEFAHAWYNRGIAYAKLGQPDKAVADYSRAIELDPNNVEAWSNRGNAYYRLGRPDKALADYSQAIELDPEFAHAWYNRGATYTNLGQPDRAVADFSKAIELAPNNPSLVQAYRLRAQAHGRLAHFEQARTDYQAFLKRAPAHAGAHHALAWLLATCPDAKLRDPDQAVALAQKAVQLAPKEGAYWNTLGVAHYRAGDWKAAVAALDKSVELRQGGDAVDRLFLGMAHRKLGHSDEARQAYAQAVQWLEKHKEAVERDRTQREELRRFRTEAEEVLEVKKK
jgi:tetratricopeptide (TPR) repeat protein